MLKRMVAVAFGFEKMNMSKYKNSKIFVCGHNGMVGSATMRLLKKKNFANIITVSSKELDLTNQLAVRSFFESQKIELVILSAAKVGGIQANIDNPGVFLFDNLMIQNNVIDAAYRNGVEKLVFLGSSCIYPKECNQPMKEEYLLTGKLEPTNEGYAIAKIAGIKMLEAYHKQYGFKSISLMPCNLYGPNDSFDLKHSHVLSALVKRFTDARDNNDKEIVLWGTGIARREFMHVDDIAEAIFFMLQNYDNTEFINIGWGVDVSIKELAAIIAQKVNYKGSILWDDTKPDGMLRKCMDVTKMKEIGFFPSIPLDKGIDQMIDIYQKIKTTA
ncbi:GDP-L-fucose synthase family protein [Flavitalea sp.]|nr:GDP-L-fucose synthase [Flavitalea sp.]